MDYMDYIYIYIYIIAKITYLLIYLVVITCKGHVLATWYFSFYITSEKNKKPNNQYMLKRNGHLLGNPPAAQNDYRFKRILTKSAKVVAESYWETRNVAFYRVSPLLNPSSTYCFRGWQTQTPYVVGHRVNLHYYSFLRIV